MIQMYNDWILVRTIKETISPGGLYIPDTAERRTSKAVVLFCPGDTEEKNYPEPDSTVIYDSLGGVMELEIMMEGELRKVELIQHRQVICSV